MAVMVSDAETESAVESPIGTFPRICNRITGTILGVGMTSHPTLHVNMDEGGMLNLEVDGYVCAPELQRFLEPGYRVLVEVDAVDVRLTVPRSRISRECNEWTGRVVSVEQDRAMVTVKIRGQQVTLKSVNMDIGLGRSLQVWDCVTLTIVPDALRVVPLGSGARLRRRLLTSHGAGE